MRTLYGPSAAALVAGLLPAMAPAAESQSQRALLQPPTMSIASPITDRFAVRGLVFQSSVDTRVRYDSSAGNPGTLVSGEDTLGMRDKLTRGSLDLMFRIGERHRIRAGFSKLTRNGDVVLQQEVRYGDDVYVANDRVLSSLDVRRVAIGYTYSLLRREKVEIGLGLDLHLLQIDGSARVPARFLNEQLDTAGPFATVAGDLTWRFTRRFSVNADVHWFDASIDEVEGGYLQWHGDVQFRAWPNLAFGLGYTHARYRVDSTDPDFAGFFNMKQAGPEAFVRVSF